MIEKGIDDFLGGLFAVDSRTNKTTFELAMDAFGEEKTWKTIIKFIPPSSSSSIHQLKNYHILQRAMSLPLKYLNAFLLRYPRAYFTPDDKGSLPIHYALKEGVEWSTELISIINANVVSLQKPDPEFDLHPFALAASGPNYDLNAIFYMLSLHPEHIARGTPYPITSFDYSDYDNDEEIESIRNDEGSQFENILRHNDDELMYQESNFEITIFNKKGEV